MGTIHRAVGSPFISRECVNPQRPQLGKLLVGALHWASMHQVLYQVPVGTQATIKRLNGIAPPQSPVSLAYCDCNQVTVAHQTAGENKLEVKRSLKPNPNRNEPKMNARRLFLLWSLTTS